MASFTPLTASAEAPTSQPQVQIKLFTRHPDIAVSSAPLLVPTSLKRYGLSQIVNHLLDTSKPTPFDFLIDGVFLQTTLDEYLSQNGLSSETTLTLEYVRSVLPPVHLASFEHDDWVSSVATISTPADGQGNKGTLLLPGQSRILSGSFDGIARIWSPSGDILAEASGHSGAIKTVGWISQKHFLTGSIDRTVRLWSYDETDSTDDDFAITSTATPIAEFHGHKSTINSLSVSSSKNQFLTASSDGTIGLWSTNPDSCPPASAIPQFLTRQSKKRKTTSSNLPQFGPLAILTQYQQSLTTATHSAPQPASATIFHPHDPQFAYSTTWSHAILTHDLLTTSIIDTRTTSHPILSLCALPSLSLLACGSSARHITLHDPRASSTTVSQATLRGHTNAVVGLSPSPKSEFLLVSAGHDGFCRVWDVRAIGSSSATGDGSWVTQGSLYMIKRESGEGGKVFGVEWSAEVGIVSGGEDKRVQVNTGVDVAGQGGDAVTVLGGNGGKAGKVGGAGEVKL
ncbi:WD40-repeat-containing domain protein [Kalaharituber pfeilii]|nr:WD40-repeat-containing domain protein [Kalaharituber pfeilii]